ncbi:MAG: tRNA U34 5-methylaminomethyl-2-thiouridine-forming methyltransferase MnmC [Candidatus Latescibacterota bacterium]
MKREFLITGDGSVTIHLPDWDEQYHSKHGAIAEAQHVFIQTGLRFINSEEKRSEVSILEIGFGTGLNALLTLGYAQENEQQINYTGVEAFPVSSWEVSQLNYPEQLGVSRQVFLDLHDGAWEESIAIIPNFLLEKKKQQFSEIKDLNRFNLIYFDAFGARVQPELWTEDIFRIMHAALKKDGVLVTYSAKGSVRRAMQAVGFQVERLPGPPGKREMLRAIKH